MKNHESEKDQDSCSWALASQSLFGKDQVAAADLQSHSKACAGPCQVTSWAACAEGEEGILQGFKSDEHRPPGHEEAPEQEGQPTKH